MYMAKKIRVNIVSESEISVQGHGVHTAYEEMAHSLEGREDVELIRGHFGEQVPCDIIHIHTVGPRTYRKQVQKKSSQLMLFPIRLSDRCYLQKPGSR